MDRLDSRPLWTPAAPQDTRLGRFMAHLGEQGADFAAFHRFSVENPEAFWGGLWDFCDVAGERGERVVENGAAMPGARFFPEARLNFTENLLAREGDDDALVFRSEDRVERRLSWNDLRAEVSQCTQALMALGVRPGDRVAGIVPNGPEAIIGLLATAALGAIWTSCSPDFGERGVLDRFGQTRPKVMFACDGYWYGGKRFSLAERLPAIVAALPDLERVIVCPLLGEADAVGRATPRAATWAEAVACHTPQPLTFTRFPADHPLAILYSSGTTGAPKCIVHSAGGTLLQHLKEHQLHCDIRADDRVFFFTTCGWMMWNWLVTALASRATLLLYDGSPFHPHPAALFDYAVRERATLFGTSAKFIDAVKKEGLRPRETHDLSSVRLICSTGSPLAAESFDYVYEAIHPTAQLASMSGGTDIMSCFVLGNPLSPVWRGEIQGAGLGMAVDVWDEDGRSLPPGDKGELVCTTPFPSMPIGFWNDPGDEKYRAAYFERFPNVWHHGDFAEWTPHGGIIIHGRSDATLNPSGVRIGTAEIYAQVEQIPEVAEALAIGQAWDNDVRIVLFVRLSPGATLDDALRDRIRLRIREGASPRHMPARIVAVADIPRTKSGKITEIAVCDVVHGREIRNKEALANPEALDLFRDLPELQV